MGYATTKESLVGTAEPVDERPITEERRLNLICRWERPSAIAHEILVLAKAQQAEVGEDYEPFDPNWDEWLRYERSGSLAVWTARTFNGVLVGYVLWLRTRGLNSASTVFAEARLIYLLPEWREGLTGYKMLKSAIEAVKTQGVDLIRVETNALYENDRLSLLLKRLRFTRVGSVWR